MSIDEFVEVEVVTDAATLADNAVQKLRDSWSNWQPQEGSLAVVQIEAIAPMAQNAAEVAARMPSAAFRKFGTSLYNLPYGLGTSAQATTTWVLADSDGHTIEADTAIAIDGYAFTVDADVTVPPAQIVAEGVPVTAVDVGSAANGLSTPVDPISVPDWVDTITVSGATSGGADAETDTSYQNRFSTLLTLMTDSPVTEDNFARLARFTGVPVGRSMAIGGYNPASGGSYDNGRYYFVAVTDPAGQPMSAPSLAAISTYLQSRREANFVVNVANFGTPAGTYATVNVTYKITGYANVDSAGLTQAVGDEIRAFLNPLTFGTQRAAVSVLAAPYEQENVVRKDQVISVIDNVSGVKYTESVTLASSGITPQSNGDLILPGAAPLPQPGTISRTP